ncbi:MAG: hypothetical protein WCO56_24400 [Verrucomicrobiota bacterium]
MRTQLQIGGYKIEFDRDATAACYADVDIPGPEGCGCADCRNWIAGRVQVVTSELRHLLSQFGIPADGEIEVWECPGLSRPHLYGGWYFIIGSIVSGEPDHEFTVGNFRLSFTSFRSFSVSAFEGQEVCELHFYTEIDTYLPDADYASPPRPKTHSETGTV